MTPNMENRVTIFTEVMTPNSDEHCEKGKYLVSGLTLYIAVSVLLCTEVEFPSKQLGRKPTPFSSCPCARI